MHNSKWVWLFLIFLSLISCSETPLENAGGGTHGGNPVQVVGVFTDKIGNPISNAQLVFQRKSDLAYFANAKRVETTTDQNGYYKAELEENTEYSFLAQDLGKQLGYFSESIVLIQEENKNLGTLILEPTGHLKVKIPPQNMESCKQFLYLEKTPFFVEIMENDSLVEFQGVPPGEYQLRLGRCEAAASFSKEVDPRIQVEAGKLVEKTFKKNGMKKRTVLSSLEFSQIENRLYKTVQEAFDWVEPGDTIEVLAGDYPEIAVLKTSGNLFNEIVIQGKNLAHLQGLVLDGANHVIVEGFQFEEFDVELESGVWIKGSGIELRNNVFNNLSSWAIRTSKNQPYFQSIRLANNKIQNGGRGILIHADFVEIEGNEFQNLTFKGAEPDAIVFFGSHIRMVDNRIFGASFEDFANSENGITGFQTWDNNEEYANHILIDRNQIFDVGSCFVMEGVFYAKSHTFVITNNICANIWLYTGIFHQIIDLDFQHNTIFSSSKQGLLLRGLLNGESQLMYNIFSAGVSALEFENPSNYYLNNNLYHDVKVPQKPGEKYTLGDPKFLDAENYDFHLLETSPAIDAGVGSLLKYDQENRLRPQGKANDLGALEFLK